MASAWALCPACAAAAAKAAKAMERKTSIAEQNINIGYQFNLDGRLFVLSSHLLDIISNVMLIYYIIQPQDNDMYGHINNAEYYSYFDTIINHFLITKAGLEPTQSKTIGLCVESKCNYYSPVEFPSLIEAGLFVSHKGSSSIKYEVGIFVKGGDLAAAHGHFVHVFVDNESRRPVALPENISHAVNKIVNDGSTRNIV